MARNCHKAVYHAASLLDLETVYVYPEQERRYGLNGGISPERVERLLEEHPGVQAVIVTSPTYDGDGHMTSSGTYHTSYYATFEVESGDRLELQVSDYEYGQLAEGDRGKLTFQRKRFLKFERERGV